MSSLEFPTQADVQRIYQQTGFENLNTQIFNLLNKNSSSSGFSGLKRAIDLKEFLWQLHYRLMGIAKSHVMLIYFFEKGIPDAEWHISPGRSGASIEYFPHFEAIHYQIKDWFDYYSDVFYYKLFSAMDMVGHILNVEHKLGLEQKKVTFNHVVDKLGTKAPNLFSELNGIRNHSAFQLANRLRNNVTHNHLPSSTGISITMNEQGGSMGIREYITSAEVMANVKEMMDLLERIVLLVTT